MPQQFIHLISVDCDFIFYFSTKRSFKAKLQHDEDDAIVSKQIAEEDCSLHHRRCLWHPAVNLFDHLNQSVT
jgi:hypothetical protein